MAKYRATVNVVMLTKDATAGVLTPVERPDMKFTVLIGEPGAATEAAKAFFVDKYGPDTVVKACNLQGRDRVLLYCQPASELKQGMSVQDLSKFIRPLPQARR